jgi:hypothetical protein
MVFKADVQMIEKFLGQIFHSVAHDNQGGGQNNHQQTLGSLKYGDRPQSGFAGVFIHGLGLAV